MTINDILYSILLVDFSPTFYCLPKSLFVWLDGTIIDISTILVITMYYNNNTVSMLGYDWWLCMVINISVQYNGGLLPDIILLAQVTTIGGPV